MRVLFVTWDSGAVDYLSSLFFPTFEALAARGIAVHTLQGTWGDAQSVAAVGADAYARGLRYQAVRMPAQGRRARTPAMVARMAREIVRYVRNEAIDVIMPRAMVPGVMVQLAAPGLRGRRIVWDADGLPADERVDFAGWSPKGPRYGLMRGVERMMLHRADAIMVRTAHAARILRERAGRKGQSLQIDVVPNGRDANVYAPSSNAREAIRAQEGILPDAPVVISVGSLGPQYYPQEQADIVAALLSQDAQAHAVFLTAQQAQMREALTARGVDLGRVILQRVPAADVPRWLAAADAGLALRKPAFSQQAVCPLKVGEYLLAGLPVIATTGVGDLDTQLDDQSSLRLHSEHSMDAASIAKWIRHIAPLSPSLQTHCRTLGMQHFSLDAAVDGYVQLLRR